MTPLMGSARKAKSFDVAWFPESVEAPRLGAPDTNALSRRQRRYRFVVWLCVILTPVAMIALLASTTHHSSKAPVATSSGAASSTGKGSGHHPGREVAEVHPESATERTDRLLGRRRRHPPLTGQERFRDARHRFQGRGRPLHRAG